jgi:hypothetical protein
MGHHTPKLKKYELLRSVMERSLPPKAKVFNAKVRGWLIDILPFRSPSALNYIVSERISAMPPDLSLTGLTDFLAEHVIDLRADTTTLTLI